MNAMFLMVALQFVDAFPGDDAAKFNAAMTAAANGEIIALEPRNYRVGNVTAPHGKRFLWLGDGATVNNSVQPTLPGTFIATMDDRVRITHRDPTNEGRNIFSVVNPVRVVSGGIPLPVGRNVSTLRSDVVIQATAAQFSREWAVTGFVQNRGSALEGVGVSGVVRKSAGGANFGGHFQVVDRSNGSVGTALGIETNIAAMPGSVGHRNRYVMDVLAKTLGSGTPAQVDAGIRIRNSTGSFKAGLIFENGAEPLTNAIELQPGMRVNLGGASLHYDAGRKCIYAQREGRKKRVACF